MVRAILPWSLMTFGGHCTRWDISITSFICHVTTWSDGHVTSWVNSAHPKLPPCKVWWSCRRGDIMFLIWHLAPHDHMVRGLCDFIGAHRSFGRSDTMFLICHMTSRDHTIKFPCNSMSGFPSSIGYITFLHVLCQFQLKIHNTYNDLRHVCLTNWIKIQHHFFWEKQSSHQKCGFKKLTK